MLQNHGHRKTSNRRGTVVVQVCVMGTALIGFAALAVDTGVMFNAKGQIQRTADAAALAAAARLAEFDQGDPLTLSREAALEFTQRNNVLDKNMTLDPADVTFGRAVLDAQTGQYTFVPTENLPNAVRVVVRETQDSSNGPLPLKFARIFGRTDTDVSAEAIAMLVPRDIAVVADLSGSHSDDSELRNYPSTDINLFNVWDRLPGGIDDPDSTSWNGDEFQVDETGYSPQMAGPGWGYMKALGYGTETIDSAYTPTADAGLVRLPYNQTWSNTALQDNLLARGYNSAEVSAIMSSNFDGSGAYEFRTAVAMGLARWRSGIAGGLWQQMGWTGGNGNTNVQSTELTWTEKVLSQSLASSTSIWRDYINSYMRSTSSEMYNANSGFRYRFGVKTFVNYLLEKRGSYAQTPELAATPHQPMQSVKDAVGHLTSTIDSLDSQDQVSLEIYGTTGRHEVDLTTDVYQVSTRLQEMQAGHYDSWTNMGAGIQRGIEELASARARDNARKVMIVLTDGVANVACENCSGGDTVGGQAYALDSAQEAVSAGIQIFTVSVGAVSDPALMAQLAALGNGEHFHAAGTIEQYSAQLDAIFEHLGGRRPVQLIK